MSDDWEFSLFSSSDGEESDRRERERARLYAEYDKADLEYVEKIPKTIHRRFNIISSKIKDHEKVSLTFSLQVAKLLLQEGLTEEPYANVACSPISMDVAFNVLAVGATGKTLEQLLGVVAEVNAAASRLVDVMKQEHGQEAPVISFANALLVDCKFSLKDAFRQVMKDVHHVEARVHDFENQPDQVVKDVNEWAEEKTKGQIKQVLENKDINVNTKMIFANALSFKGTWVETFKPKNTEEEDFYLLNGNKVRAQFMNQHDLNYEFGMLEDHNCKVLRMLYREGEGEKPKSTFSMYIFLPIEKDGLLKLLENTNTDVINFLKMENVQFLCKDLAKISIPKFSFDCSRSLPRYMKQLGLTLPFDESVNELSEMVDCQIDGYEQPYVHDMVQKSRVEIDEEGTKATVFEWVDMNVDMGFPDWYSLPMEFVADHPFMFMIREDFSGAVLFVGTILNPLSTDSSA